MKEVISSEDLFHYPYQMTFISQTIYKGKGKQFLHFALEMVKGTIHVIQFE